MANPRPGPGGSKPGEQRRWQRVRLLRALVGICARLERLQGSAGARQACREVAAMLGAVLAAERTGRSARER